jgi:hypothetical protein
MCQTGQLNKLSRLWRCVAFNCFGVAKSGVSESVSECLCVCVTNEYRLIESGGGLAVVRLLEFSSSRCGFGAKLIFKQPKRRFRYEVTGCGFLFLGRNCSFCKFDALISDL